MTELRRNPITREPILFAPGRAGRPNAFAGGDGEVDCPFCPGNEAQTPPTIASIGDPWIARAFANKYPAADGHEVIVESPRHDATFDAVDDPEAVIDLWLDRYDAHGDAKHVALFKNHGTLAGASIPHLHSQLVPLPFLPPRIAAEADAFARASSCPLCDAEAIGEVIRATPSFTWLAPHGSRMAWQQWIVPKRHAHEPARDALGELAELLQASSRAMLGIAPSHNWSFVTFRHEPRAHWYIDLFPRLTTMAGLELGSGTFIEIIDPATTARKFRA